MMNGLGFAPPRAGEHFAGIAICADVDGHERCTSESSGLLWCSWASQPLALTVTARASRRQGGGVAAAGGAAWPRRALPQAAVGRPNAEGRRRAGARQRAQARTAVFVPPSLDSPHLDYHPAPQPKAPCPASRARHLHTGSALTKSRVGIVHHHWSSGRDILSGLPQTDARPFTCCPVTLSTLPRLAADKSLTLTLRAV